MYLTSYIEKTSGDDSNLTKCFPKPPTVAFRRKKNRSNYLIHNDIANEKAAKKNVCSNRTCKTCPLISKDGQLKSLTTANCKSSGVIYGARCKKHEKIYVGHTGESFGTRISKHRYDIKKRPENNELATHFHKDHNLDKGMESFILQENVNDLGKRLFWKTGLFASFKVDNQLDLIPKLDNMPLICIRRGER